MNKDITIEVYTDGSCNTKYKLGAWAAVILIQDKKIVLKGHELNTTNNRMELLGAVKSIEYIENNFQSFKIIKIFSDSQYLIKLQDRKKKLIKSNFLTKKGILIQNEDLVKKIIFYINSKNIEFIKVVAHQKKNDKINYNREVDILSRKIVRQYIDKKI